MRRREPEQALGRHTADDEEMLVLEQAVADARSSGNRMAVIAVLETLWRRMSKVSRRYEAAKRENEELLRWKQQELACERRERGEQR